MIAIERDLVVETFHLPMESIPPLLEHLSPIEWDNVVLYGQYILDRKLVRRHRRSMKVALSV